MRNQWTKATEEQRAKHRASCIEDGKRRRRLSFCLKPDTMKILDYLDTIKKKYGIEPMELMKFIDLFPKGQQPLTADQNRQWREMATKKIPAAEIYQQIFGVTA